MAYRYDDLAPGEVYHLCTRGVNKNTIFKDNTDRQRYLALLIHALPQGPIQSYSIARRLKHAISLTKEGAGLIDLVAYCLMDNHVHLLVRENSNTRCLNGL
ncbi:hypothetical protein CL628_02365 [bacterium]|nr:hypothetical protein [bacterium]